MTLPSRCAVALCLLLMCAGLSGRAAAEDTSALTVSKQTVEAHLRFLSDDLLEGRGIGTRGGRLATAYIEAAFRAAGLRPAFGERYSQTVPLVSCTVDSTATLHITASQGARVLCFGEDLVVTNFGFPDGIWEGRLLFVGYGVSAREWSWDDYADTDVRGRVLVALANEPGRDDPALFRGAALTEHGRWSRKMEEAARRGALGMLLLHTDRDAGYGWDVVRAGRLGEGFRLADDDLALPLQGWIAEAPAREILRLAGLDMDRLRSHAEQRGAKPIEIPVRVELQSRFAARPVQGANIVGIVPGADPALRAKAIVLTAHHDHLGVQTVGDNRFIYNGAVDNGAALAVLLALAQAYGAHPELARATLVFAAVDAEEQGLLGSRYLTQHPPHPIESTLADINFEMSNVWGRTRDLQAIGAEQSTLEELVRTVAARRGLTVTPDPTPEQGFAFRSDQYSFVKVGVPAVWLDGGMDLVGREPGTGARLRAEYRRNDYHRPTDTFRPDWDLAGLVQLAEVAADLVSAIETTGRVEWKQGQKPGRNGT